MQHGVVSFILILRTFSDIFPANTRACRGVRENKERDKCRLPVSKWKRSKIYIVFKIRL